MITCLSEEDFVGIWVLVDYVVAISGHYASTSFHKCQKLQGDLKELNVPSLLETNVKLLSFFLLQTFYFWKKIKNVDFQKDPLKFLHLAINWHIRIHLLIFFFKETFFLISLKYIYYNSFVKICRQNEINFLPFDNKICQLMFYELISVLTFFKRLTYFYTHILKVNLHINLCEDKL